MTAPFVTIGRILKAHGVRGEVKVEPLTSDPERFERVGRVFAASSAGERRELVVERVRMVHGGLLIKFEGFDAPEPLAAFSGWSLEVPREEAIAPPAGQTLFADMIGLLARDATSGQSIGTIQAIVSAGNDLLEISTPDGDVLVPWVPEFVGRVDLAAGTVEIRSIPGLLEP